MYTEKIIPKLLHVEPPFFDESQKVGKLLRIIQEIIRVLRGKSDGEIIQIIDYTKMQRASETVSGNIDNYLKVLACMALGRIKMSTEDNTVPDIQTISREWFSYFSEDKNFPEAKPLFFKVLFSNPYTANQDDMFSLFKTSAAEERNLWPIGYIFPWKVEIMRKLVEASAGSMTGFCIEAIAEAITEERFLEKGKDLKFDTGPFFRLLTQINSSDKTVENVYSTLARAILKMKDAISHDDMKKFITDYIPKDSHIPELALKYGAWNKEEASLIANDLQVTENSVKIIKRYIFLQKLKKETLMLLISKMSTEDIIEVINCLLHAGVKYEKHEIIAICKEAAKTAGESIVVSLEDISFFSSNDIGEIQAVLPIGTKMSEMFRNISRYEEIGEEVHA